MPFPLLLIGGAAALGAAGVFKGNEGRKQFEEAGDIRERAQKSLERAVAGVEREREHAAEALSNLGRLKVDLFDVEIRSFVATFEQLKNTELNEFVDPDQPAFEQLENYEWGAIDFEAIDALKAVVGGLGAGAAAGTAAWTAAVTFGAASTGTAIAALGGAAAANATLAWFGGGAIAAGGLGVAGGAMVLGGVVAGPVLAAIGLVVSAKGKVALETAKADAASARKVAAEARLVGKVARAVRIRAETARDVLTVLRTAFQPMLRELNHLVGTNVDYSTYDESTRESLRLTVLTAIAIRRILDAPLLDEDGALTEEAGALIEGGQTLAALIEGGQTLAARLGQPGSA